MATDPVNQKTTLLSMMSRTATATAANVARRISLSCGGAALETVCSVFVIHGSRIEAFCAPGRGGGIALENEPVMQTERPVVPELDADRHNTEARPMRRAQHLAQTEFGGINRDLLFKLESCLKRAGLF